MSDPSSFSASGDPAFEAPRSGRSVRLRGLAVAVALLVVGGGVVVFGETPGSEGDIGVETDATDEPDERSEALQDAADDALDGPIEEEPVEAPDEAPAENGRGDASQPGSVRPGGEQPGRTEVDLADVDTPAGELVVAGSAAIAVVDLESGEVVARREDSTPGHAGAQGLAVVDDTIVQATGDEIRLHPHDLSEEPTVLDVAGSQVLVAPDATAWVGAHGRARDSAPRQQWTPIDAAAGTVGEAVDLPVHAHVRGATDEGLAVVRAGRTFLITGWQEAPTALDHGALLDAGPGGLLWHVCSEEFVCGLEATSTELAGSPPEPEVTEALDGWHIGDGSPARISQDGSSAILLVTGFPGLKLGLVNLEEGTAATFDLDGMSGHPVISPDGAWVAVLNGSPTLWAPDDDVYVESPVDVGQVRGIALR